MRQYHAKAQQLLSNVLLWLMQGVRRREQADLAGEEPDPLPERVLKRLRRMMFGANRCLWFSFMALLVVFRPIVFGLVVFNLCQSLSFVVLWSILIFGYGDCIRTHSSALLFTFRLYF